MKRNLARKLRSYCGPKGTDLELFTIRFEKTYKFFNNTFYYSLNYKKQNN